VMASGHRSVVGVVRDPCRIRGQGQLFGRWARARCLGAAVQVVSRGGHQDLATSSSSRVRAVAEGESDRGVFRAGNSVGGHAPSRISEGFYPELARGGARSFSHRESSSPAEPVCRWRHRRAPRQRSQTIERRAVIGRRHENGGKRTPSVLVLPGLACRSESRRKVSGATRRPGVERAADVSGSQYLLRCSDRYGSGDTAASGKSAFGDCGRRGDLFGSPRCNAGGELQTAASDPAQWNAALRGTWSSCWEGAAKIAP
jgi:hypothetical protein